VAQEFSQSTAYLPNKDQTAKQGLYGSFELIGGPMFSGAVHALVGWMEETNQTLLSLHQCLQQHTPMISKTVS